MRPGRPAEIPATGDGARRPAPNEPTCHFGSHSLNVPGRSHFKVRSNAGLGRSRAVRRCGAKPIARRKSLSGRGIIDGSSAHRPGPGPVLSPREGRRPRPPGSRPRVASLPDDLRTVRAGAPKRSEAIWSPQVVAASRTPGSNPGAPTGARVPSGASPRSSDFRIRSPPRTPPLRRETKPMPGAQFGRAKPFGRRKSFPGRGISVHRRAHRPESRLAPPGRRRPAPGHPGARRTHPSLAPRLRGAGRGEGPSGGRGDWRVVRAPLTQPPAILPPKDGGEGRSLAPSPRLR
ncbi:hypothetical protein ElP_09570 [Tautonia plasticadhaerens]|uniref:Uncharacterized protein n=1 Tax=Tautonia plasticadhaerens TaxID=2527974 RepID=A0A518GX03_9BACT|nr:hypothetical protein ElP_09570 [Tautonia plasticadhaerens]